MSDASMGGCLLTCGWIACGRDNDSLSFVAVSAAAGTPAISKASGDLVPADLRLSIHIHYRANAKMAIRCPIQAYTDTVFVLDGS